MGVARFFANKSSVVVGMDAQRFRFDDGASEEESFLSSSSEEEEERPPGGAQHTPSAGKGLMALFAARPPTTKKKKRRAASDDDDVVVVPAPPPAAAADDDDEAEERRARLFLLTAPAGEQSVVRMGRATADEGERMLRALDRGAVETAAGLPPRKKARRGGAFAAFSDADLAVRMQREGGLKHAENPAANPRCTRGHPLFSRHHPWVAGLAATQCTICADTLPITDIRFHCTSKLCSGAQVCYGCAGRFGPEIATALLLVDSAAPEERMAQLAQAAATLTPLLRGRPPTVARQGPLGPTEALVVGQALPLTRTLLAETFPQWSPAALDALMAAHDEANNTEAYRLAGRMQYARLSRVAQELTVRLRAMDQGLRALEKTARPAADPTAASVLLLPVAKTRTRPPPPASSKGEKTTAKKKHHKPPKTKRPATVVAATPPSSASASSSSSDNEDEA